MIVLNKHLKAGTSEMSKGSTSLFYVWASVPTGVCMCKHRYMLTSRERKEFESWKSTFPPSAGQISSRHPTKRRQWIQNQSLPLNHIGLLYRGPLMKGKCFYYKGDENHERKGDHNLPIPSGGKDLLRNSSLQNTSLGKL